MTILLSRRHLIAGLVGLVAAPAVVRAASLMPVRSFERVVFDWGGYDQVFPAPSGRPDDMVVSMFKETASYPMPGWPGNWTSMIRHRRDLADLGEPYRSQVLTRRRLGA